MKKSGRVAGAVIAVFSLGARWHFKFGEHAAPCIGGVLRSEHYERLPGDDGRGCATGLSGRGEVGRRVDPLSHCGLGCGRAPVLNPDRYETGPDDGRADDC